MRRAHLVRLQRAAGNRAARTLLDSRVPTGAAPATPVVQGRWLIDPAPPGRGYFWEHEPGVDEPPVPAWLRQQGLRKLASPAPSSYVVWENDAIRVGRGRRLVYTLEKFQGSSGSSQQTGSKDVYNPFGRFRTTATSSFVPAARLDTTTRDALTTTLAAKDKTYKKFTGPVKGTGSTPSGYPVQIVVEGGETLSFVEENDFGAVYSLDPATPSVATRDRTDQGLLTGRIGGQVDAKMAENFAIDRSELAAWHGTRGDAPDQAAVMGRLSARDVAADAGFDPDEGAGWEWLHMIAYSMGGMAVHGPQVAGNLVAGTSECNTQMIVVEELIKDVVSRTDGKAALFVGVRMADESRHIGGTITYDFELYNKDKKPVAVYHWTFNALSRRQPMVMENRSARYAARAAHPEEQTPATTHQPRSAPTAHRPLTEGEDPIDAVIRRSHEAFDSLSPTDFVAVLGALRAERGTLPIELFDELGEWPTADTLPLYLVALRVLPPRAAARTLRAFLLKHRPPPEYLDALEREVVIPTFGDAGGMRPLIAAMRTMGAAQPSGSAT